MGEPHARTMDTGWTSGGEVWPVPVECLLNGMAPTDAHFMFGGNAMFSTHFRHRFQPPAHLSTAHLAPLPSSINVAVPIAQHSLVEAGSVNGQANTSLAVDNGGPEVHASCHTAAMTQQLPMDDGEGMDDTDDGTDEEEDEEVEEASMAVSHQQQHHAHATSLSMNHRLAGDSLASCQQQHVPVVRPPLQHEHQAPLLGLDTSHMQSHCMQQKPDQMIRQSHQGHSEQLNSMTMGMNDGFTSHDNTESDSDPNSGFSVHGKMYFEGRVVLHLKQWTDSFSSCAEPQHQKGGCAVCRLRSPASHDSHRSQKEAHRHTVKGVLFTFEDCIIVELYPESPPGSSQVDPSPKPPAPQVEPQPKEHRVSVESYMTPSVAIQSEEDSTKKYMEHIDVNCLGNPVHPPDPTPKHPESAVTQQAAPTEDHSWWDEFDSSDVLKREDGPVHQDASTSTEPSCISQMKLQNEVHEEEHSQRDFTTSSNSFLTPGQLESRDCHSVVPLEDVDISPDPSSSHVSVSNDADSVVMYQTSEESKEGGESETESCSNPAPSDSACVSGSKNSKLRHTCPTCGKSYSLKRFLKRHIDEVHPKEDSFRCPSCEQRFNSQEKLKTHTCQSNLNSTEELNSDSADTQQAVGESGCMEQTSAVVAEDVAFEKNSSEDELVSVGETACNGPQVIKCDDISQDDSSSSQENHDIGGTNSGDEEEGSGKRSSKNSSNNKRRGDNGKPYKCEVCRKSFTVERRLQNHRLSHSTERSSQCEKCGKRFARKDKLMRHMYVHSEEKMFSCEICQKRFSRRDKLSDHLKSHGGADEIHNCPMCQKQFLRPDILKQHLKLHTMSDKYQCSECLRFVTGKDRLEKHMARHKEAKALGQTLLCPLCTKYFIQKQSLKAHVKKFHPNANINLDAPEADAAQQQAGTDSEKCGSDSSSCKLESVKDLKVKPFECPCCPRAFAKKQALKKHLRKHQVLPSKSSDVSPPASPDQPEEIKKSSVNVSSSSSSLQLLSSVPTGVVVVSSPHSILPPRHHSSSPTGTINCSSPATLNSNGNNVAATHISIIQQALSSTSCSAMEPQAQETHAPPQHLSHHLLAHGNNHSSHGSQITTLGGPPGHLHTNLSHHHVAVPPMQHHVGMTAQSTMCGTSYVLAYPPFSYQ